MLAEFTRLAKRRQPVKARAPKAPKRGYLNGYGQAGAYGYRPRIPRNNVSRASPTRTASVARSIRRAIRRGWPSGALDVVNDPKNKRYLTAAEEGQLRGEIAHAYFIFGVDSKAIRQARYAIAIGRVHAQLAYWAGGLAAWRSGQTELAGQFFFAHLLICPKLALVNAVPQPTGRTGLKFGREGQLSRSGI